MKINAVGKTFNYGKTEGLNSKNTLLQNKDKTKNDVDKFIPGAGNKEKVTTYTKKSVKADQSSIASLRKESERAYESLKQIIIDLLERQGYSAQHLKDKEQISLEVDETARTEAAALIADDGPLGAEAVSSRIADFAIAVSGGDKSKLPVIKEAVEKGFAQAKGTLGDLPEVSLKTYDLVMEKLDRWEKDEL